MAVIQPVRGPDFGRILGQGIQAFRGVQDIQERSRRSDAASRLSGLNEALAADPTNPNLRAQLTVLDPKRAQALQQARDAEEQRFRQERPLIASRIQGLPPQEQVRILDQQIERVRARGGDPSNTQGLRDLIAGTPEQNQQAQGFIQNAITQGEREGFLQPQAQARPEARTALARNLELAGVDPRSEEGKKIILSNLRGASQRFEVRPDGEELPLGRTGRAARG